MTTGSPNAPSPFMPLELGSLELGSEMIFFSWSRGCVFSRSRLSPTRVII